MLTFAVDNLIFFFCTSRMNAQRSFLLFQTSNSPSRNHADPQVAMICPEKAFQGQPKMFHNQFVDQKTGKWVTDFDHKATCRTDKVEILEYCKKVRVQQQTLCREGFAGKIFGEETTASQSCSSRKNDISSIRKLYNSFPQNYKSRSPEGRWLRCRFI